MIRVNQLVRLINLWRPPWSVALAVVSVAGLAGCDQRVSKSPFASKERAALYREVLNTGVSSDTETSATTVEQLSPTGYATLRGQFTIQGDSPANPRIQNIKEPAICAPGGIAVYDHQLDVNEQNGGIANVLIYVTKMPDEWVHESKMPETAAEVIFDQKQCVFLTRVATMHVGQTLKVLNNDPTGHNTKLATRKNPMFDKIISSKGSAKWTPSRAEREPVPISCAIHPWMQGWLMVNNNPYYAVTEPDGSFEIPYVPAGVPVEFRVWQERSGFLQNVTVNGSDKLEKWSKGRFKLTLEPDTPHEMDVVVDASQFQ